jgi:Arc/MetJ-type ribon-helix-helix transcriptional regulator
MSYAFPPDLQTLFQEQMSAGNYQSADDLLRDALKALSEQRQILIEEEDPVTIEGIRRGLADMEAGRGRPLEEFEAEFRAKWNMPRDA